MEESHFTAPPKVEIEKWPSPGAPPRPLLPTPGLSNYGLRNRHLPGFGISVCGFSRETVEAIVDMLEKKQQRTRDFIPVFLTDSMEFDIFRSRGFAFEYLPPPSARMVSGTVPWPVYAQKRLQLLMQKWNLARVITFGSGEFGYSKDTGSNGEDFLCLEDAGRTRQPALASHELSSVQDVIPAEP